MCHRHISFSLGSNPSFLYVPNKKDLRFSPTDIKTIVLPNIYHNADTEIKRIQDYKKMLQNRKDRFNKYLLEQMKKVTAKAKKSAVKSSATPKTAPLPKDSIFSMFF